MLATLFGKPPAKNANEMSGGWVPFGGWGKGTKTLAGSHVDEEIALTYDACWCATRILCEAVAGLPLVTYRRNNDDGRERADDLPLSDLLSVAPNPDMGIVPWMEGRVAHQANWGQGFSEIERDPRTGEVVGLWPIHPSRVRPTWATDGVDAVKFPYMVRNDDFTFVPMRRSELLHVPGALAEDGIWGKGIVAYARQCIGGSLAVASHGHAFFGSGAQPKAVLTDPKFGKDPEARRHFREEWKRVFNSASQGEIAIIGAEATYVPIELTNEVSQFLGTKQFGVKEIARFYRVPAHMLSEFDKAASYASVEMQGIEFVAYSLMPWLRKFESEVNLKLLSPAERKTIFVEFLLAALVRGDLASRMAAYQVAINDGIMTINECRRAENMPGIGPAGDVNYVPMNMTTADRMLTGEAAPGSTRVSETEGAPPAKPAAPATPEPKGNTAGAFDAWSRHALEWMRLKRAGRSPRRQGRTQVAAPAPDVAALTAVYGVLADAMRHAATKEAKAAERAAKGDFDAWAAAFWPKYEAELAGRLAPACAALSALGEPHDAADVAAARVKLASAELAAGYDTATPAEFAAMLAGWPDAAAEWACGGPGSGVPGPCPEGKGDGAAKDKGGPVKPGAPIQERLKAWRKGDKIVAKLAEHHDKIEAIRQESAKLSEQQHANYANLDAAAATVDAAKVGTPEREKAMGTYLDAKAECRATSDKLVANDKRIAAETAAARETLLREAGASKPLGIAAASSKLEGAAEMARQDGHVFVSGLLGKNAGEKPMPVHYDRAPGGRADCVLPAAADASTVRLGERDGADVAAHELGHAIEAHLPGAAKAAQDFLSHRVGDAKGVPMASVAPRSGYGKDEVGRPDDFGKAFDKADAHYVGKDYRDAAGKVYATEVTSMGIQKLYNDPAGFAAKDPEYCKMTLGILSGKLR